MNLDLEDLLFPLSVAFLLCSFLSTALIYFNVVAYAWEFKLFIFGVVSLAFSLLCLAVDIIYMWRAEEPYPYYPRSLERSQTQPVVRTNTNPQKTKTVNVDPPTREQLDKLKGALGLEKGSLQYKKRGRGIYHVVYNERKYRWRHLGSWIQLKEKLETENSIE